MTIEATVTTYVEDEFGEITRELQTLEAVPELDAYDEGPTRPVDVSWTVNEYGRAVVVCRTKRAVTRR